MIATINRLREHLDLSEERFASAVERARARPLRPLLLSVSVPFDAVSAIEERRTGFPRVLIEARPRRRYPVGPAAAHVVGYVGEINEEELASAAFAGAEPGTIVGRAGVENQYEALLQGRAGARYVEVDARGRIVGSFPGPGGYPGRAGVGHRPQHRPGSDGVDPPHLPRRDDRVRRRPGRGDRRRPRSVLGPDLRPERVHGCPRPGGVDGTHRGPGKPTAQPCPHGEVPPRLALEAGHGGHRPGGWRDRARREDAHLLRGLAALREPGGPLLGPRVDTETWT